MTENSWRASSSCSFGCACVCQSGSMWSSLLAVSGVVFLRVDHRFSSLLSCSDRMWCLAFAADDFPAYELPAHKLPAPKLPAYNLPVRNFPTHNSPPVNNFPAYDVPAWGASKSGSSSVDRPWVVTLQLSEYSSSMSVDAQLVITGNSPVPTESEQSSSSIHIPLRSSEGELRHPQGKVNAILDKRVTGTDLPDGCVLERGSSRRTLLMQ
jgi:hypothetical protein